MNTIRTTMMVLALAISSFVAAEEIAEINLSADREITVDAGATTDVARVSGGAFTLTKKGEGTLRIGFVKNTSAKLKIEGGKVAFYVPPKPTIMATAAFHVDAEVLDSQYLSTGDGKTYLSRWTDVNGGDVYATADATTVAGWRDNPSGRKPFVNKGYQNGRDVIDFGSLQTAYSGEANGYGAAMNWSKNIEALRDVYAVIGYTEDVRTHAIKYADASTDTVTPSALLSHSYTFGIAHSGRLKTDGSNPPLFWPWQTAPAQGRQGDVYYNDELQDGSSSDSAGTKSVPLGMFYLNVRFVDPTKAGLSTENANLNAFARDRSTSAFGGQRIAEYVVFAERLSDADHDAVENYLRAKWFPGRFASVEAGDGAVVEQTGKGEIVVINAPGSGSDVNVACGKLTVDPTQNRDAWLHLDASRLDVFFTSVENGTNFITRWTDANGGAVYATANLTETAFRPHPERNLPFVRANAQNGLSAIDFGSAQTANIKDAEGSPAGYGAAMNIMPSAYNTVREILFVARDHETTATILTDYPAAANDSAAAFLGAYKSYGNYYYRHVFSFGTDSDGLVHPLLLNPWQNATKPTWNYEYGQAIDGVQVSGGFPYPFGFHLVNLRAKEGMSVDSIANTKDTSFGGIVMGECFVFQNAELTDEIRTPLVKTLMTKWGVGEAEPQLYACRDVNVASNAVLSMPAADLSSSGMLTLNGAIVANRVAPVGLRVASAGAGVSGKLDLSGLKSVWIGADAFLLGEEKTSIRLVSAASVRGLDVRSVALTVEGLAVEKYKFKLRAGADGLYADAEVRKGAVLILK